MSERFRTFVADLPPGVRWILLGGAGLVVALFIAAGVWTLLERREASGQTAFASARETYRQAITSREDAQLAAAARALDQFLNERGRSRLAPEAWYFLANVEYQRKALDAAVRAYERAAGRGGNVGRLSRLGQGYALEAKGDYRGALAAYRQALDGLAAGDFLYVEALVATGRAQELLKQPEAAVEAYRRVLRDVPDSPRTADVRARLAILNAGA